MTTGAVWALVALGWLVTVPIGVRRWRAAHGRGASTPGGLAALVPLAWLLPAAGWLLVASTGRPLAGFSHHLALLTAAHFVHAGFGVSMLLWLGGHRHALWVHQVGMSAVAAGITQWPVLQPVGAVCIVVALAAWSIGNVRRIRHLQVRGWRAATLAMASVAWCPPMLLAVSWAFAQVGAGWVARSLDQMVAQHGAVNALAVVLPGLAALPSSKATVSTLVKESRHDHASAAI